MSNLILLLWAAAAFAAPVRTTSIQFENLEIVGEEKKPFTPQKRPPSEDDLKRLSEGIFDQLEALLLDIEPDVVVPSATKSNAAPNR